MSQSTTIMRKHPHQNLRRRRFVSRVRRGSTLLVVVALMGMLALLAVTFFAFASQELENAKNFKEAAKIVSDPELGPDVYFDWALRQLTVGPGVLEKNSALFGGHMSLLPNAFGTDVHPHTGSGLRLAQTPTYSGSVLTGLTGPILDLNGNGQTDPWEFKNFDGVGASSPTSSPTAPYENDLLWLNRSPSAHVIVPGAPDPNYAIELRSTLFPAPDVDYTYPDINNAYLAHIAFVPYQEFDQNGNGAADPHEDLNGNGVIDTDPYRVQVVKPSFWRPELLQRLESGTTDEDTNGDGVFDPRPLPTGEDANGNGFYDITDFNGDGMADNIARLDPTWYWAPWAAARSLRPHPGHYFVPADAEIEPSQRRFLNDNDPLGIDQPLITGLPGGSKGFPFAGPRDATGVTTALTSLSNGAWTGLNPEATPTRFDADADGDGINEAILMDLDFPVQERPSDGALYIPLFAFTVYDGDGLINLNTAGNLSGDTSDPGATGYFGDGQGFVEGGLFGGSGALPLIGPGQFKTIGQSNQGVSPAEINPAWALDADPATTTLSGDYLTYFGRVPADRWELANMEQWWAKKGRIEFGGTLPELHAGLLGDTSRLWNVLEEANIAGTNVIAQNVPGSVTTPGNGDLFPFAGGSTSDDNSDRNAGGKPFGNQGQTLAARHPISFDGRGRIAPFGNPRRLDLFQITSNPTRYRQYSQFGIAGDVELRTSGTGVGQNLMRAGVGISGTTLGNNFRRHTPGPDGIFGNADDEYMLIDDMNEIVIEPSKISRPTDETHRPSEAGVIHMSKTDIDNTGVSHRIRDLMPANIDPTNASQEANERRRRFTVISWDRKQFNLSRLLGPGADGQPGKASFDDNQDGVVDDPGELGWPEYPPGSGVPTDDLRAWEFSGDVDKDGLFEFPPANFTAGGSPVGPYAGYHPNSPFAGVNPAGTYSPDPFRPQLRRILETELGNRNEFKLQFRFNLNMLLDVVRSQNGAAHPYYSPLEYRPLTAHANDTGLTSVTTVPFGDAAPPYPPTNNEDREFWARYDRQCMARDIYVMLYMLCGGNDGVDYRTGAGATAYSAEQKRRMAQFAVNSVDSLDRDNVMTMFEYDTDLSNGWSLDDQPWGPAAGDPTAGDRGVVFGVEAQELTFSETLWTYQAQYTGAALDNAATRYDETTQDHHHLFVELRSVAPDTVKMYSDTVSTTHATAAWRLRRQDTNDISDVDQATLTNTVNAPENAVYFKSDNGNDIDPGEVFTIATADNDTGDNVSDLYVRYDPTSTQKLIAPYDPSVTPPVAGPLSPQCNLDLVSTNPGMISRYGLVNGTTTDEFLNDATAPTGGGPNQRIALVLERRLDPTQVRLPVTVNPWISVDAVVVRRRDFDLRDTDTTQAAIETKLGNLESRERREPLDARESDGTGGGNVQRKNSLKAEAPTVPSYDGTNDTGNNPFDIVQAHFDRDFVSSIELMTVPLYGPGYQTRASSRYNLSPYDQWLDTGLANDEGPFTAASMFLMPSPPNQSGGGPGTFPGQGVGPPRLPPGFAKRQRFKNHWHRLLEFVEVPTRTHLQLGGPFATTRVPGRINLNTIRHPEVLAALLDDPELFLPPDLSVDRFGLRGNVGFTNDNDPNRDWWYELLWSRDGLHPETLLTLPGMPYSKPFRGMGAMTDNASVSEPTADEPVSGSPVEDSILRSHPNQGQVAPPLVSADPASPRGLFDIGTAANANSNNIDHSLRRRMLSKIIGNSTTRSNAFYVFVHVQFHEVYEHVDGNGNAHFRVGGRIDLNNDGNTDDGHRGFFVIDRSDAEQAYDSQTGKFDWKHLVKHRLTIN